MAISEDSIRQVIAATDIVPFIGRYVMLKKAGIGVWKGLCPFHPEKTPSFNVNESKQAYKCFGCGKGGNVVSFAKDHLSLNFVESIRLLAQQAGIVLQEEARDPNAVSAAKLKSRLITVNNEAAKWMHERLLKSKDEKTQVARDYLTKRGLSGEVCKSWNIGYAPEDLSLWREWARQRRITDDELVQVGLAKWRDETNPRKGIYNFFRHRVMFTIRNDQGDTIAFSGRMLDPDGKGGKYVNSPETPIFTKSNVFFGWDKTRKAITKADTAIICEGQIDLITAVEHGVENIVAPLGTAVTDFHARLLRRHASQAILCFDADNAGTNAAIKSFKLLAPEGVLVKVVSLPKGEDPDSLIRQQGADAFRSKLETAKDFFDFLIDQSPEGLNPDNVPQRAKLVANLADNLLLIKDKVAQDSYLGRCATRMNLPSEDIRIMMKREVNRLKREEQKRQEIADRQEKVFGKAPTPPGAPEQNPQPATEEHHKYEITSPSVRLLIQLALTDAEVHEWLNEQASGGDIPWKGLTGGEVLEKILVSELDHSDSVSQNVLISQLHSDVQSSIVGLLLEPSLSEGVAGAQQALLTLRRDTLLRKKSILAEQLRRPGLTGEQCTQIYAEMANIRLLEKSIASEQIAGIALVPIEKKKKPKEAKEAED
jgi:DNA primase